MPSAEMLTHLQGNVTSLLEIWKMVARDAAVAAFSVGSRPLTFNSVTYEPGPYTPTLMTRRLGLEADTQQLKGVFGSIVTEASIHAGKWKGARITKEWVNWRDLTMGSAGKQVGIVGKFSIKGGGFEVEFFSLVKLLEQEIGDLTSPIDRRRRLSELGIIITGYTHARTVSSFTDRRNFIVGGTAQTNNYLRGGVAVFTSGLNSGLEMEIKSNTGNTIELQLPMSYNIANGDGVTLYRGYDGTRADAVLLATMIDFDGEPDTPGINELITYPAS